MLIPWDVTARKHGGHRNSVRANEKAEPYKATIRERIRVFVVACGHQGTTLKEIAAKFGKQLNQISGRCTELKTAGQIFASGRDLEGFTIYVGHREWINGSLKEKS